LSTTQSDAARHISAARQAGCSTWPAAVAFSAADESARPDAVMTVPVSVLDPAALPASRDSVVAGRLGLSAEPVGSEAPEVTLQVKGVVFA
jgi:hypothetical protein